MNDKLRLKTNITIYASQQNFLFLDLPILIKCNKNTKVSVLQLMSKILTAGC